MKTFKELHNERGFVLLVVYIVVMFVTVFSFALFARHQVAIQATERYQNRILAFNSAESGIDYALNELAKSSGSAYAGTDAFTPLTPQNDAVRCGYTITVETTAQYNQRHQDHPELYPNFVPIREDPDNLVRVIDAIGYAPTYYADTDSVKPRAGQKSEIMVFCRIPGSATSSPSSSSLFTYGVFAEKSIAMSGNSAFDSYNSNDGAYGGSNKSTIGSMAVNSTQANKLSLSGNAKINGNVAVGYGGGSNVVATSGNAKVVGTRSNLPEDWSAPDPIVIPDETTTVTLSVSGNKTVTLEAGTYHVSSLSISGNGKVIITGAVKIYVDGAISISGNGMVVPNNRPSNLLLYSAGPVNPSTGFAPSVSISGNGSFYGGVYAPNSAVASSGNGDIFGAVIAKTYTQSGNSATHFDLAMKNIPGSNPEPPPDTNRITHITAWQELNSLAWGTGS